MAKGARRPTKGMMLAVNATIDGNQEEVDRFVEEFNLERRELQRRLDARNGQRYEFKPRTGKVLVRGAAPPRARAGILDMGITINGRTPVRQLFKLIDLADQIRGQAQQELKRRPPEQLEPVKKALTEIELLRRQREKLEERIREAEGALG